jgi:hypothetical protein
MNLEDGFSLHRVRMVQRGHKWSVVTERMDTCFSCTLSNLDGYGVLLVSFLPQRKVLGFVSMFVTRLCRPRLHAFVAVYQNRNVRRIVQLW